MSLHVHRNSFNAGELSPLMDARVDEAKHSFSCRIMENFLPKIYGGAFRRPGTMYLGSQDAMANWVENTNTHRIRFANGDAPTSANDSTQGYDVGSLWLQNVQTIYVAGIVTRGEADWGLQSQFNNLNSWNVPNRSNDTTEGYVAGASKSYWLNQLTGLIYRAIGVATDSASWEIIKKFHNLTATEIPGANDDEDDGYQVGSCWVRNVQTLYRCTSNAVGAATWVTVPGSHNFFGTRAPFGTDDSYSIGNAWLFKQGNSAWEVTSLSNQLPVRLIDFNASADIRYVIALGDGYMRAFNNDGTPFLDRVGSPDLNNPIPLQLVTPYRSSEIFDVQIAQLGNLAYLCHPNHPPQKLERTFRPEFSADYFSWSTVEWSFPAFRDLNISSVTALPNNYATGYATLTFSGDPFTERSDYEDYSGARIMLSQRRSKSHQKLTIPTIVTAFTFGSDLNVLGDFQVYTYGTFIGTLYIQRKTSSGTYEMLKTFEFSGENTRQIVYSSSTQTPEILRLAYVVTAASAGATAYIEAADSNRVGYARTLGAIEYPPNNLPPYTPVPVVTCLIEVPFDSTEATSNWAIEAWAKYAGYPRSVCFHEQRLWFGGTELQPNTIWASAVGDYENFRRGAFDADSLAFTLAAQEGSAIQSMVSQDSLVIFTQSEEWTASTSQQTIITPSNIFVRRQSRFGSAHKQAFLAANNLLFLQRGNRKLRQFTHGAEGGEGQASDLSVLAEHITLSGIRQLAFQQQPDPIVWMIRNDGVLLSMTYEPDQSVIAWARHTSGSGQFESVAVIYGADGDADQVWFVVNRGGTRSIERFDPSHFSKLEQGTFSKLVYVDCAKIAEGANLTSITGLNHLEGQSVAILADGGVEPSQVVTSNQVTGIPAASVIIAGLPFTSRLQPSKIEVAMPDGTSQGRRHISKRATINLWKTYGAQYADDPNAGESNWFEILNRSTETNSGSPEQMFTGLVDINNLDAHRTSVDLTIRQTLPLPCNVLAIIPKIEVLGK